MRHWRHHPDDEALEITIEALIEGKKLFQTIIQQVKESIMATLEEASAEAVSVDDAVVAYIQQLQADLAAAQQPDPNAQAAIDAISAATAKLQGILPAAPAPALFSFTGADPTTIDTTQWAVADLTDAAGGTLYTFIGTGTPTDTNFVAYTGATTPVVAAATAS